MFRNNISEETKPATKAATKINEELANNSDSKHNQINMNKHLKIYPVFTFFLRYFILKSATACKWCRTLLACEYVNSSSS